MSSLFTWQTYLFFHLLSTHWLFCISSWRKQKKRDCSWLYTLLLSVKELLIRKQKKIYIYIYISMPHKDATVLELLTGQKQHYHHHENWSFMTIKTVERCFKTDLFVAIFETLGKIPPTPWVSLEVFLGVCFWASMENLVLENRTCTSVSWTWFKKETLLSSVPRKIKIKHLLNWKEVAFISIIKWQSLKGFVIETVFLPQNNLHDHNFTMTTNNAQRITGKVSEAREPSM